VRFEKIKKGFQNVYFERVFLYSILSEIEGKDNE